MSVIQKNNISEKILKDDFFNQINKSIDNKNDDKEEEEKFSEVFFEKNSEETKNNIKDQPQRNQDNKILKNKASLLPAFQGDTTESPLSLPPSSLDFFESNEKPNRFMPHKEVLSVHDVIAQAHLNEAFFEKFISISPLTEQTHKKTKEITQQETNYGEEFIVLSNAPIETKPIVVQETPLQDLRPVSSTQEKGTFVMAEYMPVAKNEHHMILEEQFLQELMLEEQGTLTGTPFESYHDNLLLKQVLSAESKTLITQPIPQPKAEINSVFVTMLEKPAKFSNLISDFFPITDILTEKEHLMPMNQTQQAVVDKNFTPPFKKIIDWNNNASDPFVFKNTGQHQDSSLFQNNRQDVMAQSAFALSMVNSELQNAFDTVMLNFRNRLNREFNLKNTSLSVTINHHVYGQVDIDLEVSNGDAKAQFKSGNKPMQHLLNQYREDIAKIIQSYDLVCDSKNILIINQ